MSSLLSLKESENSLEYYTDIYTKWAKYYSSSGVASYFGNMNSNYKRCEYKLVLNGIILAFMSIDFDLNDENEKKYLLDIDDIIFNPEVDISITFRILMEEFQEYGFIGLSLCSSMGQQDWYFDAMKQYKSFNINIEGKVRNIILLKAYINYNFNHSVNFTIRNEPNLVRKGAIVNFKEEEEYNPCGGMLQATKTVLTNYSLLVFDKPILYSEKNGSSDITFDLAIDGSQYAKCDCIKDCPNGHCSTAFTNRRLNKLWRLETSPSWNPERYRILHGIYVPKSIASRDICNKVCTGPYLYHGSKNGDKYHTYLHTVPYNLSTWLNSFPRTLIKEVGLPIPSVRALPELPYYKPTIASIVTLPDWDMPEVSGDNDNSSVDSCHTIKYGFIYLVQEREHVTAKRRTYKFGKTIQAPNNYLERVRSGYKKGSLILLERYCDAGAVTEIENKIKEAFKERFVQHQDGHEHFNGESDTMIRIINSIMDNYPVSDL